MIGAGRDPRSEAPIDHTATTTFGKYQLFASLGRGGMADVFLSVARGQMGFSKLAVIKRLRPALAEEAAFRTMFLDEARLAARLNHPNIVHTYEVGEQGGVYFIAMEYLEGQSLNKVVREALRRNVTIAPEIGVRIVADALAGLGYAHELRDYDGQPLSIIHRDVSPHNIFVTYDGHTKLVDFGIAKAALSSTETEVGVLKGKVAYMSPEQAMGERIDGRSDLFAMGIVLWELVAHRRLMTGESAANTLHKLMSQPIPRLSHVMPQVDPALDALVARALEKDPNARFSSAAEMKEALESWLASRPQRVREEDVARMMLALFANVRDEVKRQIQRHMASVTNASNTQELKALTAASLERMAQSGAKVSGQLLRLGTTGSGSGSGVVASYGGSGVSTAAAPDSVLHPHPLHGPHSVAPPPKSNALVLVITIGCFLLAGLLIVVLGLRTRSDEEAPSASVAAPTVADDPPPGSNAEPSSTNGAVPPAAEPAAAPPTAEPTALAPPAATPRVEAPAAARPETKAASPPAKPKPPSRAAPPAKPTPPAPAAAPAEAPGFVTLSAYPWAKVTEGGKVVCAVTPCSKVPMSPGVHSLTFENGEQPGQKQTVSVAVKSGETSTKMVGFK